MSVFEGRRIRVATYAKKHKAILITKDLEFGNLLVYPKGSHFGLVVLRVPSSFKIEQIAAALLPVLKLLPSESLNDSITIIEPGRYRIRKL